MKIAKVIFVLNFLLIAGYAYSQQYHTGPYLDEFHFGDGSLFKLAVYHPDPMEKVREVKDYTHINVITNVERPLLLFFIPNETEQKTISKFHKQNIEPLVNKQKICVIYCEINPSDMRNLQAKFNSLLKYIIGKYWVNPWKVILGSTVAQLEALDDIFPDSLITIAGLCVVDSLPETKKAQAANNDDVVDRFQKYCKNIKNFDGRIDSNKLLEWISEIVMKSTMAETPLKDKTFSPCNLSIIKADGQDPCTDKRCCDLTHYTKEPITQIKDFSSDNLRFSLFVPEEYTEQENYGLLVYISPNDDSPFQEEWFSIFREKKLIWISPLRSGNFIETGTRMRRAMEARKYVLHKYKINMDRIYLSGFSGGGRTSSVILSEIPDAFNGSFHICGVEGFDSYLQSTKTDKIRVGLNTWPEALNKLRKNNRIVLISGDKDFNYKSTTIVYKSLQKHKIETLFIDICDLDHNSLFNPGEPGISTISKSIDYLDHKTNGGLDKVGYKK
ncbi:MAG: hypothetical protein HY606_07995 [Planctomycetes bacterium]|nr:hypothetical protein [Planctomycetota bacterium]